MDAGLPASIPLLSILSQSSQVAIAVFDAQLNYLWQSAGWSAQLQLPAELVGHNYQQGWHQFPAAWRDRYQQALAGQTSTYAQETVKLSNGHLAWFTGTVEPWRTDTQDIGGVVVQQTCVTAQVQQSQDWEDVLNASPSLIALINEGGFFKHLNPSWQRVLGWTPAMLKSRPWLTLVHPEDQDLTTQAIARLDEGHKHVSFEHRYQCHDGRYRWLAWTVTRLANQGLIYALVRDISDRKQTQTELATQQELLQQVLDTTPQWLYVKDEHGHFVMANQAFAKALGSTPEALAGQRDLEVLKNPTEAIAFRQADWEVITTQQEKIIPDGQITDWQGQKHDLQIVKRPLWLPHRVVPYVLVCATDITQRKTVEVALRSSEQRYQRLMETSPVGIFYNDAAGDCIYANFQLCILTGLGLGELRAQGWLAAVHPDDYERVCYEWQQAHEGGQWFQSEYRFMRPDGSIRWVYSQAQAIQDSDSDAVPSGYVGTCTDVTDRKQTETALRRYQQAVESASDAIAITDLQGRLIDVNSAWHSLYGSDSLVVLQNRGGLGAFLSDPLALQGIFSTVMSGQSWQHELEFLNVAEESIPIFLRVSPIWDQARQIVGLVAIATDISDRKHIEQKLHQFTERLQQQIEREQLLNQLSTQIRHSLETPTAQIIDLAITEIRTVLKIDCTQFAWYQAQTDEKYWDVVVQSCAANGTDYPRQYQDQDWGELSPRLLRQETVQLDLNDELLTDDEQDLLERLGYAALLVVPLSIPGGMVGAIICGHGAARRWPDPEVLFIQAVVDQLAIATNQSRLYSETQAKAQELETALYDLGHAQSQLIQTEKMSSLGQLVAGVAHEINNPVNFIYGNISHADNYIQDLLSLIQLYQTQYPEPNAAIADEEDAIDFDFLQADLPNLLNSMQVGVDRIKDIVASLRTFSRMDEAEQKAVNLHDGIESTVMILHNRLKASKTHPEGIEVIRQYGELPLVECYAGQLNQVFMNLLSNAIDALEDYPDQPTPQITITTTVVDQRHIQVQVQDNGPGIPPETLPRLFDPFFTTKEIGKGTGLGLSISYQIVTERHGGNLECESVVGEGTTFTITILLQPQHGV